MPPSFAFRVTHRDGQARRGELVTAHGVVQTPAFMPVGTQGAVKALTSRDLAEVSAEIILANTYHLHLRPGEALVGRLGGLHRFIGWNAPILTDSGGYQAFSLGDRRVIDEDGISFRSHLDGSAHRLTPERATDIQATLGSDIAMVLDECLAYPAAPEATRQSMERTVRWARRCRDRLAAISEPSAGGTILVSNPGQAQFGIVQGGVDLALRAESAGATTEIGFEGYAIGGLSVGEPAHIMYEVVSATSSRLPADRPRYLMGAGTPADLVEAASRGMDLFDCVLPTRNARNGQLFTREGRLNIRNARHAEDAGPPDQSCTCYTCRHFSRAYLRHLFMAGEITAHTLNTLHNVHFYLDTMRRIREAIVFGTLDKLRVAYHQAFSPRPSDS
jgi:queuine tRNA-ribosyltransferase